MDATYPNAAYRLVAVCTVLIAACSSEQGQSASGSPDRYYPDAGDAWERREPSDVGMDAEMLKAAVAYTNAHETSMPRDPGAYLRDRFEGLPHQEIVGPTRERGGVNGIVLRHGYIIAEWGDTRRADMTFSVTKSYLSTVAGLAVDSGLIRDVQDEVKNYVTDGTFASEHNSTISWHNLL